jgi:hypothetical protein
VPPLPGERGPVAAERAGLQLGESLAPTRATETDRPLVADQSPATASLRRVVAGQARPALLAPVGGESPDLLPVRVDAPADLGLAGADRLTAGVACEGLDEERA